MFVINHGAEGTKRIPLFHSFWISFLFFEINILSFELTIVCNYARFCISFFFKRINLGFLCVSFLDFGEIHYWQNLSLHSKMCG